MIETTTANTRSAILRTIPNPIWKTYDKPSYRNMENLIYYTFLDYTIELKRECDRYSLIFPPHIKKRLNAYIQPKDKINSIVGKLLLYLALQQSYMSVHPESHPLHYSKNGRPRIKGSKFDFNISHSKNLVACAVNYEGPIGLDVQHKKNSEYFDQYSGLLQTFSAFEKTPQLADWVALEAKVKCSGQGLSSIRNIMKSRNEYIVKTVHLDNHFICKTASNKPIHFTKRRFNTEQLISAIKLQTNTVLK